MYSLIYKVVKIKEIPFGGAKGDVKRNIKADEG